MRARYDGVRPPMVGDSLLVEPGDVLRGQVALERWDGTAQGSLPRPQMMQPCVTSVGPSAELSLTGLADGGQPVPTAA